ncbi:putative olfactory receptor 4C6-like [Homarus americanus]|uniref:Putative olfactory receptor 4C6-like n=1 Tax=Homarus americanus TaxID=6706 RepID=A0A8J5JW06_HOMAM|nr:putative olfactory receptor 4C6-like [Homarus americanus]
MIVIRCDCVSNMPINKNFVFLTISSLTIGECVLTLFINKTNESLRGKPSTTFTNSLSGSIGVLSNIFRHFSVLHSVQVSSRFHCALPCAVCQRETSDESSLPPALCRLLGRPCFLILLPCSVELPTLCHKGGNYLSITFLAAYIVTYTLGALATCVLYVLVALEFHKYNRACPLAMDETQRLVRWRTAKSALKVIALSPSSLSHMLTTQV